MTHSDISAHSYTAEQRVVTGGCSSLWEICGKLCCSFGRALTSASDTTFAFQLCGDESGLGIWIGFCLLCILTPSSLLLDQDRNLKFQGLCLLEFTTNQCLFHCHETEENMLMPHSGETATNMRRVIIYLGQSFLSNLLLFLFEVLNIRMFLITRKSKNKESFSQTEETSCKNIILSRSNQYVCVAVLIHVHTQNTKHHETTLEGFRLFYSKNITFTFVRV